jgi:hypothetical protein
MPTMWSYTRSGVPTFGPILGVVCPHVILYWEWCVHMWSYTRSGIPTCGGAGEGRSVREAARVSVNLKLCDSWVPWGSNLSKSQV